MTDTFTLNPVKTEYPSGLWFDIAILEPSTAEARSLWNQQVSVAVEIKLWQADGTGDGFRGDLWKLSTYEHDVRSLLPFSGLSLVFVHPGYPWRRYITDFALQGPCPELKAGIWLHVIDLAASHSWEYSEFLARQYRAVM